MSGKLFNYVEKIENSRYIIIKEIVNAKGGFDFAEGKLPNNMFCKTYGFSEDELFDLENYIKNNAFLIWELARESA